MFYKNDSIEGLSIRDYLINGHTIDEVIEDFGFQDRNDFLENFDLKTVIEDLISYGNSLKNISSMIGMSIEEINDLFQKGYNRKIEFQGSGNTQIDPFDDDDDREPEYDEPENEEYIHKKAQDERKKRFNQHIKQRILNNNINHIVQLLEKGKSIKEIAYLIGADPHEFLTDYYKVFEVYAKRMCIDIPTLFNRGESYYINDDEIDY